MYSVIDKKEWKKIYLSYFYKFISFLEDNNVEYSLGFGSLLGAVRNGGMIDWDFDIDLIIDKNEMDKIKNKRNKLPEGMHLELYDGNDNKSFGINRVYIDELSQIYDDYFLGCFFDLFESIHVNKENIKRVVSLQEKYEIVKKRVFHSKKMHNNPVSIVASFLRRVRYRSSANSYTRKKILKFSSAKKSDPIFLLRIKNLVYESSNEEMISIKFEDDYVSIFPNYDNVLKTMYGDSYMIPKKRAVDNPDLYLFFRKIDDSEKLA